MTILDTISTNLTRHPQPRRPQHRHPQPRHPQPSCHQQTLAKVHITLDPITLSQDGTQSNSCQTHLQVTQQEDLTCLSPGLIGLMYLIKLTLLQIMLLVRSMFGSQMCPQFGTGEMKAGKELDSMKHASGYMRHSDHSQVICSELILSASMLHATNSRESLWDQLSWTRLRKASQILPISQRVSKT